jgi:hypothetical protein
MAQVKGGEEIVVVAPLFLARLGLAAPAARNESFCSGFRRIIFERQKQRRAYAKR